MRLAEFAGSRSAPLPLATLGIDVGLSRDIQASLTIAGLLDPPPDGRFGPVSHWALQAYATARNFDLTQGFEVELATSLAARAPLAAVRDNFADPLASRVVAAMLREGLWLCLHPNCCNIIYVEGIDPDGKPNGAKPDTFSDVRMVIRIAADGMPSTLRVWDGTTEPSHYWTVHPMSPKGAARIALGHSRAWVVGTHMPGKPQAHEALVQARPINVYRDLAQNYTRTGQPESGMFGVNQHWGFDLPRDSADLASAGCLVGRTEAGHREFMAMVKQDARYLASNGYLFTTTVLSAAEL